jgi:glycosyltransferase involved in cell wall biosynthesis
VLEEPGLAARMGAQALRIGRETYTWDANAARMERLYEGVAR